MGIDRDRARGVGDPGAAVAYASRSVPNLPPDAYNRGSSRPRPEHPMRAIAPSILSADFSRLGELVREVEAAGADRIHVDVMDGHFVPNLSMGAVVVKGLRPVTRLPLEVHLMIFNPDFFVDEFAQAGADSFLVHWEG